jgi:hypothetical protein
MVGSPKYEDHQKQYRQGKEDNVRANLQEICASPAAATTSVMQLTANAVLQFHRAAMLLLLHQAQLKLSCCAM